MTTRTMDKKIDEIKTYLEERLSTQETILKELCTNLVEKLPSELINKLKIQPERINQLENDKSLLQKQVLELKKENIKNQVASEESEQYGRRLCLRIDGMVTEKRESSGNVLHKVTEMWSEACVEIPNEVADRSYGTGPSYTDENSNVECKSVIVRFTTFRHRIMVYRAKKKMKPGLRVKLDLMESRYTLLTDDNKVVKQNPDIKFGYADISCRLKIKKADDPIDEKTFSSIVEL